MEHKSSWDEEEEEEEEEEEDEDEEEEKEKEEKEAGNTEKPTTDKHGRQSCYVITNQLVVGCRLQLVRNRNRNGG